ncbi:MAG: lycopene cyclase family protein, partial [Myxococcota bacterium]
MRASVPRKGRRDTLGYDYIVVGAGSAGCALASRLSEDPTCTVLLIEAGGAKHNLQIKAPGLVATLWRSKYDWGFRTTPQKHMFGRRGYWPRGRVLGGTSC